MSSLRTRWAAIGAAVAVTLGAGGGFGLARATVSSGERTVLVPITACRLIDTRSTQVDSRTAPLGPGETLPLNARGTNGQCTIPNDAVALDLNVTGLNATVTTFFTIWGDGSLPNASSLNPEPGQPPIPNAVTTDLTATGQFNVFNAFGTADLLIDITGYYVDHDHDDRYSQLGHTHDDRYFTESEVTNLLNGLKKTRVVVGAGEFQAQSDVTVTGVVLNNSISQRCVFAPVDLTDGATITGVTAVVGISLPAQSVTVRLERTGYAAGLSPGTAQEGFIADQTSIVNTPSELSHVTDSTITQPVVSNSTHYYTASVCIPANGAIYALFVDMTV